MNVSADNDELLKYIEIWNKIEALFDKKINKKGLYNRLVYNNNKYIKTKISPYNERFHVNKKYYEHSKLLLESICEVKNKHYPQTFSDEFFEMHSDNDDDDDNNNNNNNNNNNK